MKKICMKDVIAAASALGIIIVIFAMAAIAGGLETDLIDMKRYIIRTAICLVVLILSIVGIGYVEKEEGEYDGL